MAKQQGIRLQPKLYRSMDQMTEDCVQGRLDGFSSSLQHRAAFPVAAFFDVTPLYLAVRKGNTELLDRLDRAMESMELLDLSGRAACLKNIIVRQYAAAFAYGRRKGISAGARQSYRGRYAGRASAQLF